MVVIWSVIRFKLSLKGKLENYRKRKKMRWQVVKAILVAFSPLR